MPLNIAKKPATYRQRVNWYASFWATNTIHIFTTKGEALAYARAHPSAGVVNVDWFPPSYAPRYAISSTATLIDHR